MGRLKACLRKWQTPGEARLLNTQPAYAEGKGLSESCPWGLLLDIHCWALPAVRSLNRPGFSVLQAETWIDTAACCALISQCSSCQWENMHRFSFLLPFLEEGEVSPSLPSLSHLVEPSNTGSVFRNWRAHGNCKWSLWRSGEKKNASEKWHG